MNSVTDVMMYAVSIPVFVIVMVDGMLLLFELVALLRVFDESISGYPIILTEEDGVNVIDDDVMNLVVDLMVYVVSIPVVVIVIMVGILLLLDFVTLLEAVDESTSEYPIFTEHVGVNGNEVS